MNWSNNNNIWNNNNNFFAPRQNVVEVNGRTGAENYLLGPNSSILLPDTSAPIIWFVKTDSTGTKTIVQLDVSVHQDAPQVDLNSILNRLSALEEKVNAKSMAKSTPKQQQQRDAATADN